jgi:hypothetical protein
MQKTQAPTTVNAVAIGADAVAMLHQEMYPRKLVRVNVNGPAGSTVELYLGAYTPTSRVDSSSRGQKNTADFGASPVDIPAGMDFFVVWPGYATSYAICNVTFSTVR